MIRTLLFTLLCLCAAQTALAHTITLDSGAELASKKFSIDAGFNVLVDGTLTAGKQEVTINPLDGGKVKTPASFSIEGLNDLGLSINLFDCVSNCRWHIALASPSSLTSDGVRSVCLQRDGGVAGVYRQYFLCRKAFRRDFAAQGTCWPQTINALRGWFDAAYTLHLETLYEGIAFIARDKEVEAFARDATIACKDKDRSGRTAGYYKGMFIQLDRAKLQATQKVERLLKNGDSETAKRWADMIVQEVGADGSIRSSISAGEVRYIETILNRALQSESPYVLP